MDVLEAVYELLTAGLDMGSVVVAAVDQLKELCIISKGAEYLLAVADEVSHALLVSTEVGLECLVLLQKSLDSGHVVSEVVRACNPFCLPYKNTTH